MSRNLANVTLEIVDWNGGGDEAKCIRLLELAPAVSRGRVDQFSPEDRQLLRELTHGNFRAAGEVSGA